MERVNGNTRRNTKELIDNLKQDVEASEMGVEGRYVARPRKGARHTINQHIQRTREHEISNKRYQQGRQLRHTLGSSTCEKGRRHTSNQHMHRFRKHISDNR